MFCFKFLFEKFNLISFRQVYKPIILCRDMEPNESHECGLNELRKDYNKLKEKYGLPEFSELNELFEVEEIESCETEFLIRKIRRVISDKIAGYLKFVETILNPSNAPMFFFKMIKKLDSDDKNVLTNIYEELGGFEIEIIKLDLSYSEIEEAEFIKKISNKFNIIRKQLSKIIDKLGNGPNANQNNVGSYFG